MRQRQVSVPSSTNAFIEIGLVVFIYEYSCLPTLTASIYESKAWARWNDPALKAQPRENQFRRSSDLDPILATLAQTLVLSDLTGSVLKGGV